MTEGKIWRHLVVFSIPLLIGNFFQLMYNTVDTIVIGNYLGSNALAAVGAGFTIIGLTLVLFVGLGTGSGVVISQLFGAKDYDAMRRAVGTVAAFTVIAGIGIGALWVCAAGALLRITGVPDEIYGDALVYLRIFFSAMPVGLAFNMGSGVLRAVGDSRSPLLYLIIATIFNIVLDLLFTAKFGWGVEGVAVATALSQALCAVMITVKLMRADGPHRLVLSACRIDRALLMRMLKIGVPAGLQSSMMSISNVVVQTYINSFGALTIAAWGVTSKIDGVLIMPSLSFGMAMMTFTGQNFGARRLDRIRQGTVTNIAISAGLVAAVSAVMFVLADPIVSIFIDDSDVVLLAARFLRAMLPFYFIVPIMRTFIGVINGVGRTFATMIISLFCQCLLRAGYIAAASPYMGDVALVSSTYIVSWAVTALCQYIYYKWGGWRRALAGMER